MRAILLIASVAATFGGSAAMADPLGEILSLARRVGYGSGVVVQRRAPIGYISGDEYDPSVVRNPASEELLHMDYGTLRAVALAANADFDLWLSEIPAGEVWRKHFETRALDELLASERNAPPSADDRAEIARILGVFDRAVVSSDLQDLTRRESARTLRALLRELTTPPEQRLIRQLSWEARMLNRSLGELSTGVTWQRYLALPDGIIAAMDRPAGDNESDVEFDPEELKKVLDRYDNVSTNPDYYMIASIPAFQATHGRLTELVEPPSNTPPPVPTETAEELPPPELELESR
jgi:hypothetical protein